MTSLTAPLLKPENGLYSNFEENKCNNSFFLIYQNDLSFLYQIMNFAISIYDMPDFYVHEKINGEIKYLSLLTIHI